MCTFHTGTEKQRVSAISTQRLHRRDFIKLAAGAAATGVILRPLEAPAVAKLEPLSSGMKVAESHVYSSS